MIVVVIIGILAAIAIPGYQEYVRKSRRAEARAALLKTAQWLEQGMTASGRYPTSLPAALKVVDSESYAIDLDATSDESSYALEAVPQKAQSSDKCGTLTLTDRGVKNIIDKPSGSTAGVDDCWG